MATENALIERILSEGKEEAAKIIADAKEYALNAVRAAEQAAEENIKSERAAIKRAAEDLEAGKRTLSALEEKKIILGAKQELVETVYLRAEQKLNKMQKNEFLTLIDRLIAEYAEEGDEVVLAENSPAKAEEVAALGSVKKLALKIRTGGKVGGIILSGKTCDKDLSFKALLGALREKTEAETAAELFG